MDIGSVLSIVTSGNDLTVHQASQMVEGMMHQDYTDAQTAALLIALTMKGESVDEIVGCVKAMRKHMKTVKTKETVVDTCGTGGDGKGTFNISTAVAFVVAGAGVPVAKHGNKAMSSVCGSADVLEALGVPISLSSQEAEQVLADVGMVFLMAPIYHPAMKPVAIVRKQLPGVRTIFNYLGPLSNPAHVKRQLIGVPNRDIARKIIQAAEQLGYDHLLVVANSDGLDEIGVSSPTHAYELVRSDNGTAITEFDIVPSMYGFEAHDVESIKGGDAQTNATIIRSVLKGELDAHRDIVVINAAYVLYIAGVVSDPQQGIVRAHESIDSGRAYAVLKQLASVTTS